MADVKRQCSRCEYWKGCGGHEEANVLKFCHYLLKTDKRRVEEDGVCKSFERRKKRDAI